MSTRYTAIPVSELPYPHGLGKVEYETLEHGMRKLLGPNHSDQDTNAKMFWTRQYQQLLRDHLKPHFDSGGDIVQIAHAAAESAHSSAVFDQTLSADGYTAYTQYIAGLPTWTDRHPSIAAREAARWTHHPPTLYIDAETFTIDDGRHRLSLLRSLIEPTTSDFPVLVRIISSI
ncbi:hypothetical protein [Mycolicibacterium komossense]|uniref:Uncharacterized protein n=1 Tax=Mycolicibacterium komossense TaxID=1779 RepID=A0ABT3C718_9MYCO|nr:hypothetical protein [Mycolicibacterium komossense]MCV7225280.1 hypothetical protein [Mycolicibacterium komossense]